MLQRNINSRVKILSEGVSKVILMIDEANVIAKTLYLSFGFTFNGKIEQDEHYYDLILQA